MSIVIVQVDRKRKVWECADLDEDGRRMLRAAHVEREGAEHVRVTCADGFMLASVVYAATVPDDFTAVDIPAELLKLTADSPAEQPECPNCGEGGQFNPPYASLHIDTDQKIAESTDGPVAHRVAFIVPAEGKGFPNWRALVRQVVAEWKPERAVSGIALDPGLLAKAVAALGGAAITRMCLPVSPRASVLILGENADFALVMPMFTADDTPARVAAIAELAKERVTDAAKD